jgi:hypothetical protein
MKKIQIKPITRQITDIRVSLNIDTEGKMVYASIYYDGTMDISNITIQGDEYDAWGSDDNYIYDLILSKAGLQKA